MSPQEWSGPTSEEGGGWQEAPQGQQPPAGYQQPPPPENQQGAPQDPAVQQWQQQSQQAAPQSGGVPLKLDTKTLNMGILLGVLLAWIGKVIIIFADSADAVDGGFFLSSTGAFLAVGAALAAVVMMPNLEKTTRLGYLIFAGFVFIAI